MLAVVEPERELGLGLEHGPARLDCEEREPVGVGLIRPPEAADDHAVVHARLAVGHELPERLEEAERLGLGEHAGLEVAREEAAEGDVHPAVVADVAGEGVEPDELRGRTKRRRRTDEEEAERVGHRPQLIAPLGVLGFGGQRPRLGLVVTDHVGQHVERSEHPLEQLRVVARFERADPAVAHLGGEAGDPEADELAVVHVRAGEPVERERHAVRVHPVVGREGVRHRLGVGAADFRRRALLVPERDHRLDPLPKFGVEFVRVHRLADRLREVVVAERGRPPLVRAEPDEARPHAPGEEVAVLDGLEDRGVLDAEARGLAEGGVRVAVLPIRLGEPEFQRKRALGVGPGDHLARLRGLRERRREDGHGGADLAWQGQGIPRFRVADPASPGWQ